jgi:hypothetical protein
MGERFMRLISNLKNETPITLLPEMYLQLFVNLCNTIAFLAVTLKCKKGCYCDLCRCAEMFWSNSCEIIPKQIMCEILMDLVFLSTNLSKKTHKTPEEYVGRVLDNHHIYKKIPWETPSDAELADEKDVEHLFNTQEHNWYDKPPLFDVYEFDKDPSNLAEMSALYDKFYLNKIDWINFHNYTSQNPFLLANNNAVKIAHFYEKNPNALVRPKTLFDFTAVEYVQTDGTLKIQLTPLEFISQKLIEESKRKKEEAEEDTDFKRLINAVHIERECELKQAKLFQELDAIFNMDETDSDSNSIQSDDDQYVVDPFSSSYDFECSNDFESEFYKTEQNIMKGLTLYEMKGVLSCANSNTTRKLNKKGNRVRAEVVILNSQLDTWIENMV